MPEKGKIIQVLGPVVDVQFDQGELPAINDALTVQNGDEQQVMEVSQHIGNNAVRCIMLSTSEGLSRGMEVTATGSGIKEMCIRDRAYASGFTGIGWNRIYFFDDNPGSICGVLFSQAA